MWVFGYASLIWNPEFAVAERRVAHLTGFRRRFCMRSIHHRGTPERPGLVLALEPHEGGACRGLALRVAPGAEDETLAALRARELVSSAYVEARVPIGLEGGGAAEAIAYVVDTAHAQYCGALSLEGQARIIARATGGRGPNAHYLHETAAHLEALGLPDPELAWLATRVRALQASARPD